LATLAAGTTRSASTSIVILITSSRSDRAAQPCFVTLATGTTFTATRSIFICSHLPPGLNKTS
jgi:hypothetical protein